eukprot:TRINITY_DN17541_c0_g1_i1.p1 TRINITY_DN17541_c0_g1~~TRINITY_DN17541_c0_g1_i1.p1  ORF type:complete len:341 (+),score=55.87 TRINITY_DN17541_c0_g1_i1:30-1025(+)
MRKGLTLLGGFGARTRWSASLNTPRSVVFSHNVNANLYKRYFSVAEKTGKPRNLGERPTADKKDIQKPILSPEERRNAALLELSNMKPADYLPVHMKYALNCLNGIYASGGRDMQTVANLSFVLRAIVSYEKWLSLGVGKTQDGSLTHLVATDKESITEGVSLNHLPVELAGHDLFSKPYIDMPYLKAYCFNLDKGKPYSSITQNNFDALKYWAYWIKLEKVLHKITKNDIEDLAFLQLLSAGPICLIARDGNFMMNEDGKILAFTGTDKPFKTFDNSPPGEILPVHNWLDLLAKQDNVKGILWNHLHPDTIYWNQNLLRNLQEKKKMFHT